MNQPKLVDENTLPLVEAPTTVVSLELYREAKALHKCLPEVPWSEFLAAWLY